MGKTCGDGMADWHSLTHVANHTLYVLRTRNKVDFNGKLNVSKIGEHDALLSHSFNASDFQLVLLTF